jgi:hypothetical protein
MSICPDRFLVYPRRRNGHSYKGYPLLLCLYSSQLGGNLDNRDANKGALNLTMWITL